MVPSDGPRHAEVLRLCWGDIDLDGRTYTYEGKGGRSERRELAPELAAATERWAARSLADRRPDALVVLGRWPVAPVSPQLIRDQLQLVAQTAGLGELRRPIHTLRHTNARLRREVGASVEDVLSALDHASLATTAVYLTRVLQCQSRRLDGRRPGPLNWVEQRGGEWRGERDAADTPADGGIGPTVAGQLLRSGPRRGQTPSCAHPPVIGPEGGCLRNPEDQVSMRASGRQGALHALRERGPRQ